MTLAKIAYASMSGNNEAVAELIEKFLEARGIDVEKEEADDLDISFFDDADICIVNTFTYTEGSVPDELEEIYDGLEGADFSGKIFGVAGAGDDSYDTFCHAVEQLDAAFEKTGATRGAALVKIDDAPNEDDEISLEAFVNEIVAKLS